MDWLSPRPQCRLPSQLESIYSILCAYFAWRGLTPGYTDLDVCYAQWHTRGNL